jgi:cytochrome c oxidase cbb3-type subunit III
LTQAAHLRYILLHPLRRDLQPMIPTGKPKLLLLAISLMLWTASVLAPFGAAQELPDDAAAAPRAGQRIFASTCSSCHGLDGRGGERAPAIAGGSHAQNLSTEQISNIISEGKPGTGMPAFRSMSQEQIREVVRYLQFLQGKLSARAIPGDVARGREIFYGKGECSSCHTISGKGGFLGPDLSAYGSSLSAKEIVQAITSANRFVPAGFRRAIATTRDGERMEATVRNEDNFSLQLLTGDGRLHFFQKADLQKLEYLNQSLMPTNYGERLGQGELNDLVSYLMKDGSTAPPPPKPKRDPDE